MTISFYDVSVASYLQTLDAVKGVLEKGRVHCQENNIDLAEIVEARVFSDMQPFRFQVLSVVFHSLGAIEAIKNGSLTPPGDRPAYDYAGLQAQIGEAHEALSKLSAEEVNALASRDVAFRTRGPERILTAEGFVLSFSLPNFYFHAATAYDILRSKGVPVGKRDFIGQLRLKG